MGKDRRRMVGEGPEPVRKMGVEVQRGKKERPQPGHSGNLCRHPTRKSGQDNISKLRRTQT